MSGLKQKLTSLEKKSRVLLAHHGVTPCVPMTVLCKQTLEDEPDLRLVEPCDTDPATYWTIRLHMAWADEDYAEIARLKRDCPIPEVEYDWGPPSEDGDLTPQAIAILNESALEVESWMREERAALAAARRRLGRPEKSHPIEPPWSESSPHEVGEYSYPRRSPP